MNGELKISGEDVILSSPEVNSGKELRIGKIKDKEFIKKESFTDLLRKYQAWTLYQDVLSIADRFTFKVEEENGTPNPDIYNFTITKGEILNKGRVKNIKDQTGFNKVILPLSWFTVTTNNLTEKKKMDQLGTEWYFKLRSEFHKDYMKELSAFLKEERTKHVIYPASPDVFRAFRITPFSEVNVVILGQDPYHNGLADGLAFSSLDELRIPRSLENIFTEIENDIYGGLMLDRDVDLTRWSRQGVLLINTSLTVREGIAESHKNKGWERFTQEAIMSLYEVNRPVVWLLWGKKAQNTFDDVIAKFGRINERHLVLRAAHPSPFSAEKFYGCKHFSRTNQFLTSNSLNGIVW